VFFVNNEWDGLQRSSLLYIVPSYLLLLVRLWWLCLKNSGLIDDQLHEHCFNGNPPQIFSLVRSTCIFQDTYVPKRYMVPLITFDMKDWEGLI
jgi:hypothetical protein